MQTSMHRRYRPYTPVTCVYLKQRWDKAIFKIHREKVHAAKAVIDNECPGEYRHVKIKSKKKEYEAIREEIIKRDNQMLYKKIDHIMRTGGRTDHKNMSLCYSKSMNAAKYKRELVRVAKENSEFLRRLSEREPNYNHKKILMDWQESQQYLKNISKYPPPKRAALAK